MRSNPQEDRMTSLFVALTTRGQLSCWVYWSSLPHTFPLGNVCLLNNRLVTFYCATYQPTGWFAFSAPSRVARCVIACFKHSNLLRRSKSALQLLQSEYPWKPLSDGGQWNNIKLRICLLKYRASLWLLGSIIHPQKWPIFFVYSKTEDKTRIECWRRSHKPHYASQ